MRRLLCLLAFAAPLFAQPVVLECDKPADVMFTPTNNRFNFQFQGNRGEAVYFRLVALNPDQNFRIDPPQVSDQYNSCPPGRVCNPTAVIRKSSSANTLGDTPVDMSAQGFEYDLYADSTFTLQLQASVPQTSAEVMVIMVRLNRPCVNTVQLSCGRAAAGSISASTATTVAARPGQVDTYQFNANSGDILSIRLLRTLSSGTLDTSTYFVLAVYGPDGHAIDADPKGYLPKAQFNTSTDLTITGSGTLTILVFEPQGYRGGNYFLSVTRLNGGCSGPALSCGSYQDSQLPAPLSIGFYSLDATQGDVWQFRVARTDVSGSFAPKIEVYDALGTKVGTVGPVSPALHAAAFANISIPTTGKYTVMVSGPLDGSSGGYTISATRLNKPCAEQTLGCGSIVDGAISGILRNHVYSFDANTGDTYLLRVLQPDSGSVFRPRIDVYDAKGNEIQFLNTSDLARQTFSIPADGTYTVVVNDSYDGSQSGSYTLSLLRLNRPCSSSPLNCGGTAAGNLTRALDSGVYTYTAGEGESFSVRTLPNTGVIPALEVYDSQGNRTGQAITGAFTGVDVVKPAAGNYTIIAADNGRTPGTGTFTLDLVRTRNACGQPLAQGRTVTGVLSAAAPLVSYTLSAAQDDLLSLRSASSTPGFAAQMELYDPDGNRLDGAVFAVSRKAPAAGTYTVIVGASSPRTAGGYAFAWQALNKPSGAVPLACGGTTGGSIAGTAQFRYYTLAADGGDTVRMLLTKTSDNFAPQVELYDPNGSRLSANSDVTQKVTAGGNYLVVVSPSTTAFETGSYTLAYQRPNNPCNPNALACGQTTLRQVNLPGQLDTLTFSGTGGDLTTIRLASRSGTYSPFVELYNPAGTRLTTSANGLIRSVLALDGQYTLLVRDRGATNLGSYRVSLQDETATCPVTDSEAPAISLLRPTGGEVLPGGTSFRMQWLSDDNVGVTSHDIALSTDGGKTFATAVASGLNGNQQVYDWLIPGDVTPSRTAVIRVTATDAAGNSQSASSDLLTLIGSGFAPNVSATYTYDESNRLTQVKLDDGRTIRYTWDAAGNLVQVSVQ